MQNNRFIKSCRQDTRGLTLIELLVVLGILALFATLAAPQVLRYLGSAKSQTAQTQIGHLVSAVELYFIDVGDYPGATQGLESLVENKSGIAGWSGPYIKKKSSLIDPWKRPYIYSHPGKHGAFDLLSYGRDGKELGDGEDRDITSW